MGMGIKCMGMGVRTWELEKRCILYLEALATVLVLELLHNLRPYDHYN